MTVRTAQDSTQTDQHAPSIWRLLAEGRAIGEYALWLGHGLSRKALPKGDGHGVVIYPGFMAGDALTKPMRHALRHLGYNVTGWEQGINIGLRRGLLEAMRRHLGKRAAVTGGPVSLIGWSLGGLYARELAKREPHLVWQVITLGTPCNGDLRANNAWHLYEWVSGHSIDMPPIEVALHEAPPVPCLSIFSETDGVVAPGCSQADDCLNAKIKGSHFGLPWNDQAFALIVDRLATISSERRPASR